MPPAWAIARHKLRLLLNVTGASHGRGVTHTSTLLIVSNQPICNPIPNSSSEGWRWLMRYCRAQCNRCPGWMHCRDMQLLTKARQEIPVWPGFERRKVYQSWKGWVLHSWAWEERKSLVWAPGSVEESQLVTLVKHEHGSVHRAGEGAPSPQHGPIWHQRAGESHRCKCKLSCYSYRLFTGCCMAANWWLNSVGKQNIVGDPVGFHSPLPQKKSSSCGPWGRSTTPNCDQWLLSKSMTFRVPGNKSSYLPGSS